MDLSSALFSPSKARQQQALAQDWIFVDSWLSKKYHPKPVPPFERNEDTLQALMTLVAFNERADEERVLVERVERMALRELEEEEKSHPPLSRKIHETLQSNLSPAAQVSLTAQAEVSILLSSPSTDAATLGSLMITKTNQQADLSLQESRLAHLGSLLEREHARVEQILREIHNEAFMLGSRQRSGIKGVRKAEGTVNDNDDDNADGNDYDDDDDDDDDDDANHDGKEADSRKQANELRQQVAAWTKETKMLQLKIAEYEDRLAQYTRQRQQQQQQQHQQQQQQYRQAHSSPAASDPAQPPRPTIDEVAQRKQHVQALAQLVKETEEKIRWFAGLPPDIGEARKVLEGLKGELGELVRRRDGAFEGLLFHEEDGGNGRGGMGKSRLPVGRRR